MTPWWLVAALAADPELLTFEEALRQAAASPTLRQAELRLAQADEDVRSAWGGFDPTLNLNAGWNRSQSLQFQPPFPDPFTNVSTSYNVGTTLAARAPTGTAATLSGRLFSVRNEIELTDGTFEQRYFQPDFRVELSQELLRGVLTSYNLQNVRKARDGLNLAELELERTRQQVLADVARSYWEWVHADRASAIARDAVAVAEEALRVGAAQVDAGQAAPVERTRLEAALVQARSEAITAENTLRRAADALLVALGRESGALIQPASPVGEPLSVTVDATKAADVALAQGVDVLVARARADAARLDLRDARHNTWPTLTGNVEAGFQGGDDESWAQAFDRLAGFPTIGVSGAFSVPLGSRAARGARERAALEVAVASANVEDVERQVVSQVQAQVRALMAAREQVALADANLRLAEETLAAEVALADAGRSILKDVLEARTALDRARVVAVRARVDARLAEVELRRLQGTLE